MKLAVLGVRALLSLAGVALLVSGVMFWLGRALSLVPLHMLFGAALVVILWIAVGLAFYSRTNSGLAMFVLAWSLIVLILGVTQIRLLPGSLHWIVRTIHLLVGFAAVGLGHVLAKRIGGGRQAAAAVTGAD